jgi:hypothetical protein
MIRPQQSSAVEGDIVVTPVAGQYAIGRVTADARTQAFIETQPHRTVALKRACELAGTEHRVFFAHSNRQTSVPIDCAELGPQANDPKR